MKKRILIAGKSSFIGESFRKYMQKWPDDYTIECLDMIGDGWKQHSFSGYDAVFMVAGIAHVKETDENRALYYKVNRDLALDVAKAAKLAGVGQFIYLSTMNVYGIHLGSITKDSPLKPDNAYAESKLQAETLLSELRCESFAVSILRPPMVYGKDCKGTFRILEKLALSMPFFPKVNNQRSVLYIDNLSECVRLLIDRRLNGCFCPQNREYVSTYEMARRIAAANGKKLLPGRITGLGVRCFRKHIRILRKSFGTLIYQDVEQLDFEYCVVSFEDSIRRMYQNCKETEAALP
jgi:UDP-glucose 4-epimerase